MPPSECYSQAANNIIVQQVYSVVLLVLLLLMGAVLIFAMGNVFLPGGPAFATLVIWICSVVGAQIAHLVSNK